MNKTLKIILIVLFVGLFVGVLSFFVIKNKKSIKDFKTQEAFITTINKKAVATGKVVPEYEIEIKPQVSGIIDGIFVEEGQKVNIGDLIAKVKVVPNEQSLNSAKGRIKNTKINYDNQRVEYRRNRNLYNNGVISNKDFIAIKLTYLQAKQNLQNAENDFQIIKKGSIGGSKSANTDIRATISGTILEIKIKEGNQVIESNNFNDGTTIAFIADLNRMMFEGKVDESEVSKLEVGTVLDISIGAIPDKKFKANLNFVAPKGIEDQGAVLFTIKADMVLDDENFLRAGYSANAELILETKKDVLAIKEALLQYDRKTEEAFVEVLAGTQSFEKRILELGISDGINIEIVSGITKEDKIKDWNETSEEGKEKKK